MEQAIGVLLHAAVEHHPQVAWKEGMQPLLLKVLAELQPHAAPGGVWMVCSSAKFLSNVGRGYE